MLTEQDKVQYRQEVDELTARAWAKGVVDGFLIAVVLVMLWEAFKWVGAQ